MRQSAVSIWNRGGGLETPPDTDAVQCHFHVPMENAEKLFTLSPAHYTTISAYITPLVLQTLP
jgi:hypothetical protein